MMVEVAQCCSLKQSFGFPDVLEVRKPSPLPHPEPVIHLNLSITSLCSFSSLLLHLMPLHAPDVLLCSSAHVLLSLLKVISFLVCERLNVCQVLKTDSFILSFQDCLGFWREEVPQGFNQNPYFL